MGEGRAAILHRPDIRQCSISMPISTREVVGALIIASALLVIDGRLPKMFRSSGTSRESA